MFGVSLGLLAGFEAYVCVSFHLRCWCFCDKAPRECCWRGAAGDVRVVDCCVFGDLSNVLQEFFAHGAVGFHGERSESASFSGCECVVLGVL